jgi:hypothetical protein
VWLGAGRGIPYFFAFSMDFRVSARRVFSRAAGPVLAAGFLGIWRFSMDFRCFSRFPRGSARSERVARRVQKGN